jgi:hypothetical protein
MLWSLDQDDYTGLFCGQGQFPFTRCVYDTLQFVNNSNEQEFFNSTIPTEQKTSSVLTEWYTTEHQILTSTQLPSDSIIINRSVKNIYSFYLILFVLLSI